MLKQKAFCLQNVTLRLCGGTLREAQSHGLSELPKRAVSGATPLRRANRSRFREHLRRAYGLFAPKPIAINLQGCQLLFWNFFLFGKEKSASFPFSKGFLKTFLEKVTPLNKNLPLQNQERHGTQYARTI